VEGSAERAGTVAHARHNRQVVRRVSADGGSVAECIASLEASYPGLKERLCDESGEIRRFVNIYVNGEDVRFLQGLATPLKDGDEVSIVPAVAGGGRKA
jgi:molybdopterin synthase sulfur carrier subunit